MLRNIKTDDLARKMLAYKNKPVQSWKADDWGLLDALNQMLTLRANSRGKARTRHQHPDCFVLRWRIPLSAGC